MGTGEYIGEGNNITMGTAQIASPSVAGPIRVLDGLAHCALSEPIVGLSLDSHGFCTKNPFGFRVHGLAHGTVTRFSPSKTHVKPIWVLMGHPWVHRGLLWTHG